MFKKYISIPKFKITINNPRSKVRKVLNKRKFLTKRQRLVVGVIIISAGLFFVEQSLKESGIYFIILLAFLTVVFLYWALKEDLKNNFILQIFILPFFFTLSFGLFYLLFPERILVKIALTIIFAIGIYSVYLSQNIFTISSVRTIALLSSARTVSFITTLISFFILMDVIFSLHLNIIFTMFLISLASFPLIVYSIWSYSLDKNIKSEIPWGIMLTLSILEVGVLLWFWPSTATIIALFLTGFLYIILGLSHLWFEKRLFKNVLWEYIYVAVAVFFMLVVFTPWT